MSKNIPSFDYLKIFANLAVIMIHIISQIWSDLNINASSFFNLTLMDALIRWAVPVFIMISGALFLGTNKDKDIVVFLKKYVLKIYLLFIIWNMIYLISQAVFMENNAISIFSILSMMKLTLLGNGVYHLWYLPLIICLYLLTPILNIFIINASNNLKKYYLLIMILFVSLLPSIASIFNFSIGFPIKIFGGFLLYYLLGYYIFNNIKIKKSYSFIIYILGSLITFYLTLTFSKISNAPLENYFDYLNFNVLLTSVGIFMLFNSINFQKNKFIETLGSNSLGIYLIHGLIFGIFSKMSLIPTANILLIFTYTFIIYFISFVISYLIRRIPILRFAI